MKAYQLRSRSVHMAELEYRERLSRELSGLNSCQCAAPLRIRLYSVGDASSWQCALCSRRIEFHAE